MNIHHHRHLQPPPAVFCSIYNSNIDSGSSISLNHRQPPYSAMPNKLLFPLLKPALRSVRYIPTSLVTLPASVGLHFASHPAPTISNYVISPTTSPLHPPLIFTLASIPVFYLLGLVTGKVSWVDKAWPLYPPVISAMLFGWVLVNHAGGVYAHNIPRIVLMFGLQVCPLLNDLCHPSNLL